jgi:hypothetical protein
MSRRRSDRQDTTQNACSPFTECDSRLKSGTTTGAQKVLSVKLKLNQAECVANIRLWIPQAL